MIFSDGSVRSHVDTVGSSTASRGVRVGVAAVVVAATWPVFVAAARAQISEDPWTVAPGRAELEVDFTYAYDRDHGATTHTSYAGPLSFAYGLSERAEAQIGFDGYQRTRTRSASGPSKAGDWGDLSLGAKYHLIGHDTDKLPSGRVAFAALPYVVLPLKLGDAGSDQVRGGLSLPFAVGLPAELTLYATTGFDCVASRDDTGHEFQWIQTLALSRELTSRLTGFVELYSALPAEPRSDWTALANVGVTCACNEALSIEASCAFGLSRAAPDVQPTLRFTYLY